VPRIDNLGTTLLLFWYELIRWFRRFLIHEAGDHADTTNPKVFPGVHVPS
jgi:hypothetical protein